MTAFFSVAYQSPGMKTAPSDSALKQSAIPPARAQTDLNLDGEEDPTSERFMPPANIGDEVITQFFSYSLRKPMNSRR